MLPNRSFYSIYTLLAVFIIAVAGFWLWQNYQIQDNVIQGNVSQLEKENQILDNQKEIIKTQKEILNHLDEIKKIDKTNSDNNPSSRELIAKESLEELLDKQNKLVQNYIRLYPQSTKVVEIKLTKEEK